MIIKKKKHNFFLFLSILVLLFIVITALFFFNEQFVFKTKENIKQKMMMFDHGFSSVPAMLYRGVTTEQNKKDIPKILPGHLLKSFYLQFQQFPNRPTIKTIEININFKNYQKILEDRKKALYRNILTNPKEVNANIKYDGKKYKAKIRLKGDFSDHWSSFYRMSFRVKIKSGTILGFKSFSVQKPVSRQHPYDQVYGKLIQSTENISPKQTYARIILNGENWGIMNIEEHISKELLEKQKKKESIVVKLGNEKDWNYFKIAKNYKYKDYRLSDPKFDLFLYGKKKNLKNQKFRLWFSYISDSRLNSYDHTLYDVNKFSQVYLLTKVCCNEHSLSPTNSRYYFNPYSLKLEPIPTDAGYIKKLDRPDYNNLRTFSDPYNMVIGSGQYIKKFNENFNIIKKNMKNTQKYIDFYQSFFPADDPIYIKQLIQDNIKMIESNQNFYLFQKIDRRENKITNMPTKDQAKFFPEHIYAKHYSDGVIDIYNLLPDEIIIKKIRYKNDVLAKDLTLEGFKELKYFPLKLKTKVLGLVDKQITIETEYKGEIRDHIIDISFFPGPHYNPLSNINLNEKEFLKKENDGSWLIKKGTWKISKPITLKGKVIVEAGTRFLFSDDSYLIVKGQLIALGTENDKIVFDSKSYWKGLYVVGDNNKESILNNVIIKNTTALVDGLLHLTGGVNFYNSKLQLKNTQIINSKAEDALNIIHSNFVLQNVEIGNTNSDGFDSDFSKGNIYNSKFFNIGGDAIDFSGSNVNVTDSSFNQIKDKAISVGESSNIDLKDINMNNVGVGVASKDGSITKINGATIQNYNLAAMMAYNKKDFYDQPILKAFNIEINPPKKEAFLSQENTEMTIDNKKIVNRKIDVKLLYQTEIMKK
jgi:hypothetical protein